MGGKRQKVPFELVRFLHFLKRFLGCAQQTRVVDGDRGVSGSDGEQGGIMLVEDANTFVERFQHTDRPVLDGHRHAE